MRAIHAPVDKRAVGVAPQNVGGAVSVEITDAGDVPTGIRCHDRALNVVLLAGSHLRAIHGPIGERSIGGVTPRNIVGTSVSDGGRRARATPARWCVAVLVPAVVAVPVPVVVAAVLVPVVVAVLVPEVAALVPAVVAAALVPVVVEVALVPAVVAVLCRWWWRRPGGGGGEDLRLCRPGSIEVRPHGPADSRSASARATASRHSGCRANSRRSRGRSYTWACSGPRVSRSGRLAGRRNEGDGVGLQSTPWCEARGHPHLRRASRRSCSGCWRA